MNDLIDTTEMYLRVLWELAEQGIPPLRARIVERLGQASPTVSQTVARMERDGLLNLDKERHIVLTDEGEQRGMRVMRRHRIAECMLVGTLAVPFESAHDEACRWEHVLTDDVERRMWEFCGRPATSPYGNSIPGLDELDPAAGVTPPLLGTEAAQVPAGKAIVTRMSESLQAVHEELLELLDAGIVPGAEVDVVRDLDVRVVGMTGAVELGPAARESLYLQPQ